jgi:hypothetical protein
MNTLRGLVKKGGDTLEALNTKGKSDSAVDPDAAKIVRDTKWEIAGLARVGGPQDLLQKLINDQTTARATLARKRKENESRYNNDRPLWNMILDACKGSLTTGAGEHGKDPLHSGKGI